MTDFLSTAAGWLSGVRHARASVEVFYLPIGELTSWTVRGTPCGTDAQRLNDGAASVAAGMQDWLFRLEDFAAMPAAGDLITDLDGRVWEVVERSGAPVWWYADEYKQDIRVHSVLNE